MRTRSETADIPLLGSVPLFAGLDEDALREIGGLLKRRHYRRGEVVYHAGDLPGSLYIVMTGQLLLRLQSPGGKQLAVAWIRPGDFVGSNSALEGRESLAETVAMRPSDVLMLRRDDFLDFVARYPGRSQVLLEINALRWRKTLWRLA